MAYSIRHVLRATPARLIAHAEVLFSLARPERLKWHENWQRAWRSARGAANGAALFCRARLFAACAVESGSLPRGVGAQRRRSQADCTWAEAGGVRFGPWGAKHWAATLPFELVRIVGPGISGRRDGLSRLRRFDDDHRHFDRPGVGVRPGKYARQRSLGAAQEAKSRARVHSARPMAKRRLHAPMPTHKHGPSLLSVVSITPLSFIMYRIFFTCECV